MNLSGGFTGVTGDYSTGAAQVIMPHVTGSNQVYEQQTSWPVVLENSKVVVFWGLNPISTLRVAWTSSDEQGFKYFEQLKNSDKEIIIIDPIKTVSGKYFEDKARWITPRPNTDVAMMLGMAQHLYSQGKYNKEFLQNYTVGFEKFVPYLTGQSDGVAKTQIGRALRQLRLPGYSLPKRIRLSRAFEVPPRTASVVHWPEYEWQDAA